MDIKILKGDIATSVDRYNLKTVKDGYVVVEDGICKGVFEILPDEYRNIEITDYSHKLIMPGLNDLHIHASQYQFRGLGMDLDLLEWLEKNAFKEELRFIDDDYALKAYSIFAEDLLKSPTTRFSAFATIHSKATLILMKLLEEKGLKGYVGKVNMTRNSSPELTEDIDASYKDTVDWIDKAKRFKNIKPIITPRFIPSCDDDLMYKLGELAEKENLKIQSHLNESDEEIKWVQSLCPWSNSYADAYDRFKMMNSRTIMAHCVYDYDLELLKEKGVFVAHCPECNANIRNGIAPVKKMLDMGINVGLGTDVAGGSTINMFSSIKDAIKMSKIRWKLSDDAYLPLSNEEAFYMATAGGGAFFGKVGMFEDGYEFDAIVIDDSSYKTIRELSIHERLERVIQLYGERDKLTAKYVAGRKVL